MDVEPLNSAHSAFLAALAVAGSQVRLAEICGCTQGNIWQLKAKKSSLPGQYVLKVEAATGVSRHQLRPDLYPDNLVPLAPDTPSAAAPSSGKGENFAGRVAA
jgi:DNA-binding transcriptional regulator YdaS (Cro superfamily)